jgi:hypothetical protein
MAPENLICEPPRLEHDLKEVDAGSWNAQTNNLEREDDPKGNHLAPVFAQR